MLIIDLMLPMFSAREKHKSMLPRGSLMSDINTIWDQNVNQKIDVPICLVIWFLLSVGYNNKFFVYSFDFESLNIKTFYQ